MKVNEVYLQKLDCEIRDKVRDYIKSNDKDQCDLINLISFVYDMGWADGYSETVTKADNSIGAINSMLNSDYSIIEFVNYKNLPLDFYNPWSYNLIK